jgi:hypothetical protein
MLNEGIMKTLLLFLPLTFLLSCGLANERFFVQDFKVGDIKECTVGQTMITEEAGMRNTVYKVKYDGYKWELVYSGKEGDILHVQYREYVITREGTLVKEGFAQQLTYDISESDVIAYKDVRLKVLEMTSSKLLFEVLPTSENQAAPSGK